MLAIHFLAQGPGERMVVQGVLVGFQGPLLAVHVAGQDGSFIVAGEGRRGGHETVVDLALERGAGLALAALFAQVLVQLACKALAHELFVITTQVRVVAFLDGLFIPFDPVIDEVEQLVERVGLLVAVVVALAFAAAGQGADAKKQPCPADYFLGGNQLVEAGRGLAAEILQGLGYLAE